MNGKKWGIKVDNRSEVRHEEKHDKVYSNMHWNGNGREARVYDSGYYGEKS